MAASIGLLDASLSRPAGWLAGNVLRCRGLAKTAPLGHPDDPDAYVGDVIGATRIKSAIAALDVGGTSDGPVQRDFLGQVLPLTLLGRLPGLRLRPFKSRALVCTGGTRGAFVAEGAATPMSGLQMTRGSRLEGRRVSALDVTSREQLMLEPGLDGAVTQELAGGFAGVVDAALLDPTADGTGAAPAGILHGAASTAATGDAAQDVLTLFAGYVGDWRRAAIILHPATSVALGLALEGSASDTSLGATGGRLAGVPAIASEAVPYDSTGSTIAILDIGALAAALAVTEVVAGEEASILMDDAPSMTSTSPTAAQLVSMFQSGSVAFRAEGVADWQLLRADAIFTLTDATYAVGS